MNLFILNIRGRKFIGILSKSINIVTYLLSFLHLLSRVILLLSTTLLLDLINNNEINIIKEVLDNKKVKINYFI